MNILITGGAGFIGSNIADFHLGRGDAVVAVDDLSTGKQSNLTSLAENPEFRFIEADLRTWEGLADEVAIADRIYHMAAVVGMFVVLKDPVRVTSVNVIATENILQAAARSGRKPEIVIASSSSVYGQALAHHQELHEDIQLLFDPQKVALTGYALSKLTNEIQAKAYRRQYDLPVTIARLFNAAGPRQTGTYGYVIPRFVEQAVSGKALTVFGDGNQTRSFCDVRDTITALDLLAGEPAAWGNPVNVGNADEISVLDLARLVIERAGSSSPISFLPFDEVYGEHFEQITQRRPTLAKLEELTGFSPRWTLETTIDNLIGIARKEMGL